MGTHQAKSRHLPAQVFAADRIGCMWRMWAHPELLRVMVLYTARASAKECRRAGSCCEPAEPL